jgi:aminoglycoside/choline kinase family phosphotransferase
MNRDELKIEFLRRNNLGSIQRIALRKDASYRQYERIIKDNGETLILMDAPPEKEDLPSFIDMANFLRKVKLSSPEIISLDIENGFLLLEDFGCNSYTSILSGKSKLSDELDETMMYEKAIDTLIHLHKVPHDSTKLDKYDEKMLIKESMRFIDFYVSIVNGEIINKSLQEEYIIILKHLLSMIKGFHNVITLRDYHADNLMWLDDRTGINKVGLLDFQDAVVGHPAYDIVSLLKDARRDLSPQLADKMIQRYLQAFPNYSRKEFAAAYAILGVQRNLKIIGVFARQASHYKNPQYLFYLPRVWRHISSDLKHPLLLPLKNWLNKVVPSQLKDFSK